MSYDFIVYVRDRELPDPAHLARALLAASPSIRLVTSLDLRQQRGLVPISAAGIQAGFELSRAVITDAERQEYAEDLARDGEDDDGYLAVLTRHDTRLSFSCRDQVSIDATRTIVRVLATLAGGHLSDPQTGEEWSFSEAPEAGVDG